MTATNIKIPKIELHLVEEMICRFVLVIFCDCHVHSAGQFAYLFLLVCEMSFLTFVGWGVFVMFYINLSISIIYEYIFTKCAQNVYGYKHVCKIFWLEFEKNKWSL